MGLTREDRNKIFVKLYYNHTTPKKDVDLLLSTYQGDFDTIEEQVDVLKGEDLDYLIKLMTSG